MPTPTWVGDTAIHLAPGFPRRRRNATADQIVLTYRGPYTSLVSGEPDPGDAISGYTGYSVESVETYPDGAGTDGPGTQVIILSADSPAVLTSEASEDVEEIEAGVLEKKLESHPIYQSGGTKELTTADLDDIAEWRAATTAAQRASLYGDLSANAQHFVAKVQRGIESYLVAAPVTRKTTRSYAKPTVGGIGTRTTSQPVTASPSGYQWLKTGDRAVRQGPNGKWERVQEWTGADAWDSDLYPAP